MCCIRFNFKMCLEIIFITFIVVYPIFSQEKIDIEKYLQMPLEEFMNVNVITASKRMQPLDEAPATMHVITEEIILLRGYSQLADVLQDIPEIEIQKKSGPEMNNIFSFRGVTSNEKFIILLNGIRINAKTPHTIGYNYPLVNVKRIEILLGPASALYGADAFNGVVNIITNKDFSSRHVHVSSNYGMYGTTENALTIGFGNENISFSLSGSYYASAEPNLSTYYNDTFKWYNSQYRTYGNMLMFGDTVQVPVRPYQTPTRDYFVHAHLKIHEFEFGYCRLFDSHSSSVGDKPEFALYIEDARFNHSIETIYAKHAYETPNKKWIFDSAISGLIYEMLPETKYISQYSAYQNGYKYAFDKTIKIEEQISWIWKEKSNLSMGISYEFISSLPKTSDMPVKFDKNESASMQHIYYLGTNLTDNQGKDLTIYQDFYYLKYQNFSSYLQIQTLLGNSIGITLGERYDYNTRYGHTYNPRIGLVFFPSDKFKCKLLYGRAYLAPSPYKAYQQYGSFYPLVDSTGITGLASNFWHLPNPDLKPQKLRSFEMGLFYFFNKNFSLSVNGYYNFITDLIVTGGFFGETFKNIPIDYVERFVNRGESVTYGGTIKLDSKIRLSKAVTFKPGLSYSYSDGDIDGQPLIHSAKHTLRSSLDFSSFRFLLSFGILYRSKSHHRDSQTGNPLTCDPFTVVNLSTRYAVLQQNQWKLAIHFKASNLLNVRYFNAGYTNLIATPQDPVRISGGITLEY